MGLQNIFEMAKADRYTADGREELAKAREADVEDRTYNIGEISQKTGLQKTANGWVKPRAESNTAASKSPEASFKSTKPAGTIEKGKVFVDRFGGSESLKVDEVGGDGSFSYTITKSDGSKASGKASNEKELRHILETSGYGERKGDSESKAKFDEYGLPSKETIAMKDKFLQEEKISNPEKLTNAEFNALAEKLDKKLGINNKERAQELLVANDSAPRVLTGDCKVRVRK